MTSENCPLRVLRVPNSAVDEILNKPIQNHFLEAIWVQRNVTFSQLIYFQDIGFIPIALSCKNIRTINVQEQVVFLGRSLVTEQKPVRLCLIEIPGKVWHGTLLRPDWRMKLCGAQVQQVFLQTDRKYFPQVQHKARRNNNSQ